MKKFWKALGLTALAATLIPYYVDEDKETGSVTVKALFWKFTKKTGADGQKDITLKFLSFGPDEEDSLFTDNPEDRALCRRRPGCRRHRRGGSGHCRA